MAEAQCKFVVWFLKLCFVSFDSEALRKPRHVLCINIVSKQLTNINNENYL